MHEMCMFKWCIEIPNIIFKMYLKLKKKLKKWEWEMYVYVEKCLYCKASQNT